MDNDVLAMVDVLRQSIVKFGGVEQTNMGPKTANLITTLSAERDKLLAAVNEALRRMNTTGATISWIREPLREVVSDYLPQRGKVHWYKGVAYEVLFVHEDVLSQYEGEWQPTVEYCVHKGQTNRRFTRALKEFQLKFMRLDKYKDEQT